MTRYLWIAVFVAVSASLCRAAPFVPPRDAHCVAFSADGQRVAIGISGQSNSEFPPRPHPSPRKCATVQLFDLVSRKRLRRLETYGDLTKLAFSPDGSLVATSRVFATDDGVELNEVRVWETSTGLVRFVFDRCHAFSFAPDRRELVVVSRKRCVVYDLDSGEKLRQLPQFADALAISHALGGELVLGVVQAGAGFSLRSCDSAGTPRAESTPVPDPFYSLAVSDRSRQFATGHPGGTVFLWDLATLRPIGRLATGGTGRAFPFLSPAGDLLGIADQSNSDVLIVELASGQELARYTYKQGSLHTYRAKSPQRTVRPEEDPARFVFSPDGQSFLGGPYGGILRLVADGRDIARFGE